MALIPPTGGRSPRRSSSSSAAGSAPDPKKRGHGAGKVKAPGGRLEAAETPEACARRELREEVGMCCGAPMPVAYLCFHDRADAYDVCDFAFRAATFEGAARETPETAPFWCAWDAVPYGKMWAADRYWIPSVRAGRPVRGDFVFEGERLVCRSVAMVQAAGMPRFLAEWGGREAGALYLLPMWNHQMSSVDVSVTLKTAIHKSPNHRWKEQPHP